MAFFAKSQVRWRFVSLAMINQDITGVAPSILSGNPKRKRLSSNHKFSDVKFLGCALRISWDPPKGGELLYTRQKGSGISSPHQFWDPMILRVRWLSKDFIEKGTWKHAKTWGIDEPMEVPMFFFFFTTQKGVLVLVQPSWICWTWLFTLHHGKPTSKYHVRRAL